LMLLPPRTLTALPYTTLFRSETASLDRLDRIRRLGIGLAIDDFGRGYSSLGYLKQLPATEIKIDKRFVENVAVDSKDRDIVRAIDRKSTRLNSSHVKISYAVF